MTNTTASLPLNESNGLIDGHAYHSSVDYAAEMTLAEVAQAKGRITRVRILAEGLYCDISYIHATLPDGRQVPVRVSGGIGSLFRNLKKDFIDWAKEEGVFAKGLGLLDEGNWSVLR